MDIGTISMVLMLGLLVLLAIGMPLGMASAILAVLVLVMKFEPQLLSNPMAFGDGILTGRPGSGPLNILAQKIYGLLTDYVLISIPLFIFMAALLERSGIAKDMYSSLNIWLNRTRGGIAIVTSILHHLHHHPHPAAPRRRPPARAGTRLAPRQGQARAVRRVPVGAGRRRV